MQMDCYKQYHQRAYHPDVTQVYINFTNRSNKLCNITGNDRVAFVGLQYFIIEYLIKDWNYGFFNLPKEMAVRSHKRVLSAMLGYAVDVGYLEDLHDLGYLPLRIKALPEGSLVPYQVAPLTITNTVEGFQWLPNMIETALSTELWPICTSATTSIAYMKTCREYFEKAGVSMDSVPFMLHDFSFRGMFGRHAAAMSGFGHLCSGAVGTDTIPAVLFAEQYYNANCDVELVGCSVNATEHSTSCSWQEEGEEEFFDYLMNEVSPTGILSLVSDTWSLWSVVTELLPKMKDRIMARDGQIVCRPDCYDEKTQILTENGFKLFKDLGEYEKVAQVLDDGSYEFVIPTRKYVESYLGDMYHFTDSHGKVDLLVTPDHRMIMESNGKEKIVLAKDMLDSGHHYQSMSRSARQGNHYQCLSDYERLMIAFQADGSFQTKGNKIRFSFSKQRKMDRLESLLNRQDISFAKYFLGDGRVEYNVDVNAKDFKKDLSWVNTSEISFKYARDFIEELSYWDATRRSGERFKFDTTVESVSQVVELVSVAAGYGVLTSEREDNRSPKFSKVFTSHILKDNKVGGQSWTKEKTTYSGKVYCVQVPTGRLIVKRNRCTMVCGNSGDPVKILTGYTEDEIRQFSDGSIWKEEDQHQGYVVDGAEPLQDCEVKGLIECLWDTFGGTLTEAGYKVLDEHIGAIYGDAITLERQEQIYTRLMDKGFAPTVVLGIGSYSFQYVTRDTHGSAVKATNVLKAGEDVAIFKDPKTDKGKKSAKGFLRIEQVDGEFVMYDNQTRSEEAGGLLETVFEDGRLIKQTSLSNIRELVQSQI
jgi:nicotinic acid phosphoribosyltransferase